MAGHRRSPIRISAVKPVDAIEWARRREVELPADYYGKRIAQARALAFSVAGMAKLDQIEQVRDSLNRVLEEGGTFDAWREDMLRAPEALALPRRRLDNIFRTNLQSAYMAGRCRAIQAHKDTRPYLLYSAVNDSRTRPSHAAMDGTILPVDDPWWEAHMPPNGFRCFLPGTRVSGNFRIGLKAFYSGRAVEIVTARGVRLSVTVNHPILTRRGWVRADEISEGDDLICYRRDVLRLTRCTRDIDDEQFPPKVEEVFDALASQRLGLAKPSSFDLYGDARFIEGDVHVSGADSVLMDGIFSTSAQCVEDDKLKLGDHSARCVTFGRVNLHAAGLGCESFAGNIETKLTQAFLDVWLRYSERVSDFLRRVAGFVHRRYFRIELDKFPFPGCLPRLCTLPLDKIPVLLDFLPLHLLSGAPVPRRDSIAHKERLDSRPAHTLGLRYGVDALSIDVSENDGLWLVSGPSFRRWPAATNVRSILDAARFDSVIAQQSEEEATADSALFEKLAHDCAGDVLLDKVTGVRDFTFRGHVYDFQTENGLISANGIITHNCRCTVISLTEEQARRRGISSGPPPGGRPDDGWDYSVCAHGQEEGVRRAVTRREAQCGDGAAFADRKASILEDPVWCRSSRMRRALEAIQEALDKWDDPERLARDALGIPAWRKHVRVAREAARVAGIETAGAVVLRAYTDRELDIWRDALLLGRIIVHDAALRGWTTERMVRAGLFLYLMNDALMRLKPERGTFFRLVDTRPRGFGQRFLEQHRPGRTVEFVVPTSVMRSRELLAKGGYVGDVLVEIDAHSARDIQGFSVKREPELLLPTGTQVIIKSSDDGSVVAIEVDSVKTLPSNKKFSTGAEDEYDRRARENSEWLKKYRAEIESGKRRAVVNARWQLEAGAPVSEQQLERWRKWNPNADHRVKG